MVDKVLKNSEIPDYIKPETILACIGTSIYSENLIKEAYRFSKKINADLIVLYIETENTLTLSDEIREIIAKNLHTAESLGARVKRITGKSIEKEIAKFASQNSISKIIIGKPSAGKIESFFKHTIADKIIRDSGGIDVFVLHYKEDGKSETIHTHFSKETSTLHYLYSFLLVAVATILGYPLRGAVSPTNIVMLYLCAVVISALYLRLKFAIISSFLGVLAFNFFFTEPYFSLTVNDSQYIITFVALFAISVIISVLVSRAKKQTRAAIKRESQIQALFSLNRDLYTAKDKDKITRAVINNVNENLKMECILFVPENNDLIAYNPEKCEVQSDIYEISNWVYKKGESAGFGTAHMNATDWRFFPLNTKDKTLGVLAVKTFRDKHFENEQSVIFNTFSYQIALAFENIQSEGKLYKVKI